MPYLPLFVLRVVSWVRSCRLVVTWHESWTRDRWVSYLGVRGLIASHIEQLAARLPDAIVAASPITAERLRVAAPRQTIVTAPNGVDLKAIAETPPSQEAYDVVVVGRLLSHKRLDLVIGAVAELRASNNEVRCLIVGQGPAFSELTSLVKELRVSDLVTIKTDVSSDTEVVAYLKAAGCSVLASEREGFGIVALEALACGTPTVTTSAPDNNAVAIVRRSKRGIVCAPSTSSIAAAVVEALALGRNRDRDRSPEAWLAEYDWELSARTVYDVLVHHQGA